MQNSYNIYRMLYRNSAQLEKKIKEIHLIKQSTQDIDGYILTFYFSEHEDGNEIWWYKTYKDFFKPGIKEPKNIFYYGLLIIENKKDKTYKYLVSLGKSHFYLQKIIETDFGINVAVHIAKEETLLMKKSRLFSGSKIHEIASYIKFEKNNYRPGESVDHLKLKAVDESIWGDKNIVFADSIQLDLELPPTNLVNVIKDIEISLSGEELISLPKLEKEKDEQVIIKLNTILIERLLGIQSSLRVNDYTIFGIEICFNFLNYKYEIYYWDNKISEKTFIENIGTSIDTEKIGAYLKKLPADFSIDNVKVRFFIGDKGKFTQSLKELLDIHITLYNTPYALKNGNWYFFNQVFMDFLNKSINSIPFYRKEDFIQAEYLSWKSEKERRIQTDSSDDSLLYPEYYFNEMQSTKHGYQLLDRECKSINSLKQGAVRYKIEVADLYLNKTIFSVKLGDKDKSKLIYNIEQSKDSILLIKNGTIATDKEIESACLWFVFPKLIEKIIDINSLQFLLAIESWKQAMLDNNINPLIFYSHSIYK